MLDSLTKGRLARPEEYESCTLRASAVRNKTRKQCRLARICWWCGNDLSGRQVYWCGDTCQRGWRMLHDWGTARSRAMWRAGYKCQRCGKPAKEVNHRNPLVGRGYHAGCVHHPDNLEPLCHECHLVETIKQLRSRKS